MIDPEITKELQKHGYDTISVLGKGGYACCYLVYSQKYRLEFACKVMPLKNTGKNNFNEVYNNELVALTNIVHQYIIPIYETFVSGNHVFMILEYCQKGDLFHYVRNNGPIKDEKTLLISILQILDALQHLESLNITHNDIKPGNFLIDKYGRIKLTDFGISKHKQNQGDLTDDFRGSPFFCSPEILEHKLYDPYKAQIWSLGVTIYFLATGMVPFNSHDITELRLMLNTGYYRIPTFVSPVVSEIIRFCLQHDPSKRATIIELKTLIEDYMKTSNVPSGSKLMHCNTSRTPLKLIFKPAVPKKRIFSSHSRL